MMRFIVGLTSWKRRRAASGGGLLLGCTLLLVMAGCGSGEPALSKGSVKLVEKLRASVSAKRVDWLEASAKQIDTAAKQGKLTEDETAALGPIVAAGRQGDWDDAQKQMARLIQAQHGR